MHDSTAKGAQGYGSKDPSRSRAGICSGGSYKDTSNRPPIEGSKIWRIYPQGIGK